MNSNKSEVQQGTSYSQSYLQHFQVAVANFNLLIEEDRLQKRLQRSKSIFGRRGVRHTKEYSL